MTDRISLTGLRAHGRHGVLPQEKETPQLFVVDLDLFLDLSEAGERDDLGSTIDYGALAESVHAIVEGESHSLIERLASRIVEEVLANHRVERARVTVHKPDAPITKPFQDVSVTVERAR